MLSPLTPEQIQHYHDEGYVILGRVLDDATLDALRGEEAKFREAPPVGPNELTIFRSQVCHYSQPVRELCVGGPHLPLVQQLIGAPNIAFWFNQFVTKLPDAASGKSEFPWHQDNGYVSLEPATNVTVWIALDDVNIENGCVWVMPRSHKQGLLPHGSKSAESWHLEVSVEGDGLPAILRAGEAVAFSGLTLHRSKLNFTNQPRRAFFMEYCDATASFGNPQTPEAERRTVISSSHSWVVSGALPWPPANGISYY